MWGKKGTIFEELRGYIEDLPVIDTHDHYLGICENCEDLDILDFIAKLGYYPSDLQSSAFDAKEFPGEEQPCYGVCVFLSNRSIPFDKRYEVWRKYHERTCYTAYAKAFTEGLKICWGIKDLSKGSLLELQEKMRRERNQSFFDRIHKRHRIKVMIINTHVSEILNGKWRYNKDISRFVLNLPQYHDITKEMDIRKPEIEGELDKRIVSLDDYLEGFEGYLKKCVGFGIVGIKDQTAYTRKIEFKNVSYHRGEEIFNEIISHPRNIYGTNEVRDLDDFLFHYFMKLAKKYNIPVQLHTGHMAGIKNEISKTNAVHLTSLCELHQEVVFDIFHGNWPYMGEVLFLCKNYPNLFLNMCWVNAIDPLYSVELFKKALVTVPHSKISGFGGDATCPEGLIGYLVLAKDNIATALAEMVETGWIGIEEAKQISEDWLFNNPNRIFSLGV